MRQATRSLILAALIAGCSSPALDNDVRPADSSETARPASIRILSWNIESGGNDSGVIAQQLRDLAGYDIYALQEVSRSYVPKYASAFGEQFSFVMSTAGGNDRLLISFDARKFEQLEIRELASHGDIRFTGGHHRLPLLVRLRHRDSNRRFVVIVLPQTELEFSCGWVSIMPNGGKFHEKVKEALHAGREGGHSAASSDRQGAGFGPV